ncbi:hypothetical protein [Sphingobium lignivorans]|uniref:Uncharacterized protein n=1 Tax=Sphingobium lignivorans TaxID=2735886 RepID=A0ABR6NHT1_9SPHN|nr:hypothetical protein [Sphingobium lignivorans]MBB5986839.1 hypothetical protein [Sphingobium lignivorans]
MKWTLGLMGFAGLAIFGSVLVLTYVSPIHVERAARVFVQSQIKRQIKNELGIHPREAREVGVGGMAEVLAQRNKEEISVLRQYLASGLDAQIADTLAKMQDADCECREFMRRGLDRVGQSRLSNLQHADPQLRRIIQGKYSEIVTDLLRDLRIYLSTSMLAFVLLLVLSIARPSYTRQLFVPGILLGVTVATGSVIYLFGQNWFFTLLYGDFVGWTYGLWLLLIFGLFCDIVLFKAKVTTRIVDALSPAVPC